MNGENNNNNNIVLYPSNWLYNAGVVGFLSCLDRKDYIDNFQNSRYKIKDDGTISITKEIFGSIKLEENYFNSDNQKAKVVNLAVSNKGLYPNFAGKEGEQKKVFIEYVKELKNGPVNNNNKCCICKSPYYINKDNIKDEQKGKFFEKIEVFNMAHNKLLASSLLGGSSPFPNTFWNCSYNDLYTICHLCTFLLIHHHLALTKVSDGSEIFINAPSFELMYRLNKVVREVFGKEKANTGDKRKILAMSIIEYATRFQVTLGKWSAINIEIVIKKGDDIDFYSLPYEVVDLISDRIIASILSDLGETSILDLIISGKISDLEKISYKILRASFKNESISSFIKLEKNKSNLISTTHKILKLYANIIDRRKKWERKS